MTTCKTCIVLESFLSFEKYVFFSVGVAMTDYGSKVIVPDVQGDTDSEFFFILLYILL